jgi:hypothetical protein
MLAKARFACGLLCCLALVLLVALGRTSRPRSAPIVSSASTSDRGDCRACHAAVWNEWEASYHSKAWSDDQVQAAFQHFGFDRKCQSCHAPAGGLAELGEAIAVREEHPETGVTCLNCHGLPDGTVAASRTIDGAACRPRKSALLGSSRACGGCHEAIYKDWQESRYRIAGKSCQACHMPAVASRPDGRSHICLGSHDDALVRSGAKLECRQDGHELIVSVTNHATGHNFPGERHNRVLLVQVIERTEQGEITLAEQSLIKGITPFRGESSREQIRVDQTFEARFRVVDSSANADVQLLYKPFPWYPDDKALVVHRLKLELRSP